MQYLDTLVCAIKYMHSTANVRLSETQFQHAPTSIRMYFPYFTITVFCVIIIINFVLGLLCVRENMLRMMVGCIAMCFSEGIYMNT
jgi:hypothetical protein